MSDQLTLAPEKTPEPEDLLIDLRLLPPSEQLAGQDPDSKFIESVRKLGVLNPVLIADGTTTESLRYRLLDGRRRVKAAREAGLESIPARLIAVDAWHGEAVLTLTANQQRSENAVSELEAIEALIDAGASEQDIYQATGTPIQRQRRLLKLRRLLPALYDAMDAGKVKPSVAEQAARLPECVQKELLHTLDEKGRLTAADIHEARVVEQSSAVEALPLDLFETPEVNFDWRTAIRQRLDECLKLLPEDAGDDSNLEFHLKSAAAYATPGKAA